MAAALIPSIQLLVPFLFVFAVVFGLLEITHVFKNKAVEAAIAVALAVFAASQPTFTTMLMSWLPSIVSFFVIIFFIAFVLELVGMRRKTTSPHEKAGYLGVALILLFTVGGFAFMQTGLQLPIIGGAENIMFALGLIFIAALFWIAFKIGEEEKPQAPQQRGG